MKSGVFKNKKLILVISVMALFNIVTFMKLSDVWIKIERVEKMMSENRGEFMVGKNELDKKISLMGKKLSQYIRNTDTVLSDMKRVGVTVVKKKIDEKKGIEEKEPEEVDIKEKSVAIVPSEEKLSETVDRVMDNEKMEISDLDDINTHVASLPEDEREAFLKDIVEKMRSGEIELEKPKPGTEDFERLVVNEKEEENEQERQRRVEIERIN